MILLRNIPTPIVDLDVRGHFRVYESGSRTRASGLLFGVCDVGLRVESLGFRLHRSHGLLAYPVGGGGFYGVRLGISGFGCIS